MSRDICFCPCPGTKGHRDKNFFLSRDKGTTGQRDVPSRFVPGRPAGCPVPWKQLLSGSILPLSMYLGELLTCQLDLLSAKALQCFIGTPMWLACQRKCYLICDELQIFEILCNIFFKQLSLPCFGRLSQSQFCTSKKKD